MQRNIDDEDAGKQPAHNREYDEGPPASKTRDDSSHHSSPQPSDVQQGREFKVPKVGGQREITGGAPKRTTMPEPVTKHPEPRGRPRQTQVESDYGDDE